MIKSISMLYAGCLISELIIFFVIMLIGTTDPLITTTVICGCAAGFFVSASMKYRSKNKEVADERTILIAHRSAYYAYFIMVPQIIIAGAFLFATGNDPSDGGYYAGIALIVVGVLLAMTYSISYATINGTMQRDG